MDGRYTLDVIGTGTGDFDVEVRISDDAGNWISQTYSGTTTPGHITRFSFFGKLITFAAFNATMKVNSVSRSLEVNGTFTLGSGGAISPATQPVTVWTFQGGHSLYVTIPVGSFKQTQHGAFVFEGVIHGVQVAAELAPTGGTSYTFQIKATVQDASDLPGDNPDDNSVEVQLAIGNKGGKVSIKPDFGPKP